MKAIKLLQALALAVAPALALAPSTGHAANADNPYGNVDRRNDIGNDTGDSRVEGLNSSQLNENYRGPVQLRPPAADPQTAQTPPGYAPR